MVQSSEVIYTAVVGGNQGAWSRGHRDVPGPPVISEGCPGRGGELLISVKAQVEAPVGAQLRSKEMVFSFV